MDDVLIDKIYEAAFTPEQWPDLLDRLGQRFRSRGGLLFSASGTDVRWVGGGEVTDVMREFLSAGWMAQNPRPALVVERAYPGFMTELDVMSDRDTYELPVYKEFLRPRGFFATSGTYVQGLNGDHLILSLEGFASHDAARASVAELDTLRPHLARSVQLAAQFRLEKVRGYVEAMGALGAAAGVVSSRGMLMVANERFQAHLGKMIRDGRARLQLSDARADAMLDATLRDIRSGASVGRSLALHDACGQPRVLHIVPVCGRANDLFVGGLAMLVLTNPHAPRNVNTRLVAELFDLTPAEARIAAMVCGGGVSLRQVAEVLGVSSNTVKTQLQAVFDKTGTKRQRDLATLLTATASV